MPTEGWLRLNGSDAWRVVITRIRASGGVGLARITVELELRARSDDFVGSTVWLGAILRVHSPGLANAYLCDLVAAVQPSSVTELSQAATVTLQGNLSLHQLKLIESARSGGVDLEVELRGHALVNGGHVAFWMVLLDHAVDQSRWVEYLGAWGYRNVLLLEIDHPSTARTPELSHATQYLREAQDHFLRHDPRPAVESLRQCLVALTGATTAADTRAEEVAGALRAARNDMRSAPTEVGYIRRLEIVRQALKYATDLGAHPETDETTIADAEALFLMTAGLVQRLAKER
jgi:hypothetical protein